MLAEPDRCSHLLRHQEQHHAEGTDCRTLPADDQVGVPRLGGATASGPVSHPLVIVEVLSPSTSATDRAWKLREYFRLASVRHYLIVWADRQQIVHHQRDDAGTVATTVLTEQRCA